MSFLIFSIIAFVIIFVFFLVVVRTLGSIVNYFTKVEYWAVQELEFNKEQLEIKRAIKLEESEHAKSKKETADN